MNYNVVEKKMFYWVQAFSNQQCSQNCLWWNILCELSNIISIQDSLYHARWVNMTVRQMECLQQSSIIIIQNYFLMIYIWKCCLQHTIICLGLNLLYIWLTVYFDETHLSCTHWQFLYLSAALFLGKLLWKVMIIFLVFGLSISHGLILGYRFNKSILCIRFTMCIVYHVALG